MKNKVQYRALWCDVIKAINSADAFPDDLYSIEEKGITKINVSGCESHAGIVYTHAHYGQIHVSLLDSNHRVSLRKSWSVRSVDIGENELDVVLDGHTGSRLIEDISAAASLQKSARLVYIIDRILYWHYTTLVNILRSHHYLTDSIDHQYQREHIQLDVFDTAANQLLRKMQERDECKDVQSFSGTLNASMTIDTDIKSVLSVTFSVNRDAFIATDANGNIVESPQTVVASSVNGTDDRPTKSLPPILSLIQALHGHQRENRVAQKGRH